MRKISQSVTCNFSLHSEHKELPVGLHYYLREVTAEAGRPAALGAGTHAPNVFLAQDLITTLRVGAPGQVGAALNIASQKCILILKEIHFTYFKSLKNTGTQMRLKSKIE